MDTDIIVTSSSPSDPLPSTFGDRDANNLDRLAASLHHLALCCSKPGADKVGKHSPVEAVAAHEQLLTGAVLLASEQL